jgi:hypothetical protein
MALVSASDYAKMPSSIAAENASKAYTPAKYGGTMSSSSPGPAMPNASTPSSSSYSSGSSGSSGIPGTQTAVAYAPGSADKTVQLIPHQVNGSMYQSVPGTDWWSVNPSNPNAPKYTADGKPVASISYSDQQTGQNFSGYGNQDQFNQIKSMSNNPSALASYMSNAVANNQLIPNSSIYSSSSGIPMSVSQVASSSSSGIPGKVNSPGVNTAVAYSPGSADKTVQLIPQAVDTSIGKNPYGILTKDQINAQAAAQIASETADKTRIANQTKAGYQTSYDRMNQQTTDTRNLENFKNSQLLNPFNGYSDYAQGQIARDRATTDRQNQQDLQTKLGGVDSQLSDYLNSTPAEQQKIINDMTQQERNYFLQSNAQALQSQQMAQNQSNADRTFKYGVSQDAITNNRNATNDEATFTGYYTSPETKAAMDKMVANSAAYATATPQEQARLHQENVALGKQIGLNDTTGNGDYSGNTSTRTIAGQTLDTNNAKDMATLTGYMSDGKGGYIKTNAKQQQDLTNAWTESTNLGFVTPTLSQFTGIPVGTQTQAAKASAAQIAISKQNANTSAASSSASAGNAASRLAWDKDPNNPDNRLKESEITKNNAPKAKDYKTDPNFAADIAHMKTNPNDVSKLDSNAQSFIDAYGYDGYAELRKASGIDK